jgi:hypothetical protein
MHIHQYPTAFREGWYFLCFVLLLAACTTSPSTTAASPTPQKSALSQAASLSSPPPVPETCQPTPFAPDKVSQAPEAQGKATNAELWVLFFADPQSLHTGQEVKIVWRMTGSGHLQVVARHAGDVQIKPVWGPEDHGGSNWNRPGAEWGTGFKLPSPGCWDLHATRDAADGDVWIWFTKRVSVNTRPPSLTHLAQARLREPSLARRRVGNWGPGVPT